MSRNTHHRGDRLHFGQTLGTFIGLSDAIEEYAEGTDLETVLAAIDAMLSAAEQPAYDFTLDAVLKRAISGSFTLDAIKKDTESAGFTLDAHLEVVRSGSFTMNADLKKTQSGSFTLDAVLGDGEEEGFSGLLGEFILGESTLGG